LSWLDHLPEESLEGGIILLNRLLWSIKYGRNQDGLWIVQAGHCVIFKADSQEAIEAFLYGMSLSYSVMKPELLDEHRADMLRECGLDPTNPTPENP
jgi:hypothetical protein